MDIVLGLDAVSAGAVEVQVAAGAHKDKVVAGDAMLAPLIVKAETSRVKSVPSYTIPPFAKLNVPLANI